MHKNIIWLLEVQKQATVRENFLNVVSDQNIYKWARISSDTQ